MRTTHANDSAFPVAPYDPEGAGVPPQQGMAMREWYAGQALAGALARKEPS
jgi:hypothetical protein